MLAFIYKDYIQNKQLFLGVGIFCLLLAFLPFLAAGNINEASDTVSFAVLALLFFPFIFLMLGFLQAKIYEEDERVVFSDFICSTPMGVKGFVASKYWATFLISMYGLGLGIFTDLLVSLLYPGAFTCCAAVAQMLFFFQLAMRSFEIPFMFRFGSRYGSTYKTIMMIILFLMVFIYLLFGDLSHMGSFDEFLDFAVKVLTRESTEKGFMIALLVSPHLVVLCYYVSYRISCKVYRKGVENYEG